jgi:hypothetical protein
VCNCNGDGYVGSSCREQALKIFGQKFLLIQNDSHEKVVGGNFDSQAVFLQELLALQYLMHHSSWISQLE